MIKRITVFFLLLYAGLLCLQQAPSRAGWLPLVKAAAVGTTTLDSVFSSGANVTFSNGNLTITGTSSTNNLGRSLANHTTGKFYCEFTVGTATNAAIGVADVNAPNTEYVTQTGTHSMGTFGTTWSGGGTTTAPALINAHVYGFAVDVGNSAVWLKDLTAAGNWNANGAADPATNTNGATYALDAAAVYVAVTVAANGDNITFNFSGSAYTGTPPSAFVNW